ncbi:spheroidene monooxygenase [Maritimibacter sp. UBA3975]|nr:spheroidene monooxygenase [Maritimibacter sp. UBA3975]|tara:strand:- start:44899 stop:45537 length:639 start_codon:yes stop_codon:yes gene_type:complete
MMGLARGRMRRIPGIGFWKLCGSGTGEGFTPVPNTAVYAILAAWPDAATAHDRLAHARIFQRYRERSREHWTVFLSPVSVRGAWSGVTPFQSGDTSAGPIAALTRATIRPAAALRFWRRVPDISAVIGEDANVMFKIGIGEVPLLHQITFSIWPDADALDAFAHADGPHARAVRAVRAGDWFREELFARFRVLDDIGSWHGTSPLSNQKAAA